MLPSYETITRTFTHEFIPATTSKSGMAFLQDLTLGYTWNGLMSKDHDGYGPLRVVSAWRAIVDDGCTEDSGYDEWGLVLMRHVERDLGKTIAATNCYNIAPLYQSYAWLFQAFGESWPVKALAARLRRMEGIPRAEARALAEVAWVHALKAYDAHKAAAKQAA